MKAKFIALVNMFLYVTLFLFCIVFASVLSLFLGFTVHAGMAGSILSVAVLYLIKRRKGQDLYQCFSCFPLTLKTFIVIIILSIIVTLFIQSFLLFVPEEYFQMVATPYMPKGVLGVVSIAVTSPIAEEVYFRGFILKGLSEHFPKAVAVIITSFMFSGLHDGAVWGLMAFLVSIFYSILFLRSKTIVAPIMAHITSNCIAVAFNAYVLGL